MDLKNVVEELYTLHPTQFVGARTARVDEALAAGRATLAAQIAALRRPALSAWASNLLVHSEPEQVARLLRLGEGLRQAHRKLARTQLRRLGQQQRTLVGALSQQARTLAAEAGHPLGEGAQRKVEQTLHAALADPAAAEKWASGRLVRALVPPVGFTADAERPVRPVAASHRTHEGTPPPKPEHPAATPATPAKSARRQRRAAQADRKPAQARRKAEAAEQRARHCEKEHDQAQAKAEQAEAALRELEERATELAQQLHATVELRRRMRDDLDRARDQAAQKDRAARQARHAAETARAHAEHLTT
ncbi:hypothetical protein [Streptomyces sp. NPDC001315]|uniref:hypothetical protein n=1 Tax=Streptomyces sp. NPDC001315 TaxID=3364562 RepID=UPI0036A674AA